MSLKRYLATEPPSGGFVITTGILSYAEQTFCQFFGFYFDGSETEQEQEQQISFSNNMKYSDFIAGKYFLQN